MQENETQAAPEVLPIVDKPKKRIGIKGNKLTLKQKAFAIKTVQTLNPAQAAREVYDVKNDNVGYLIARENMRKPIIQREIERIMAENGVDDDLITRNMSEILKEKAIKKPTWAEKHAFVRTYLQLTGKLQDIGSTNTNIGIVIEK